MRKIILALLTVSAFFSANAQSRLCGWNVRQQVNYGLNPFAATSVAPSVSSGGLNRAFGVGESGTAASRAWGGTGWNHATPADAIAANTFITAPVLVREGYFVSFYSINPFDYRRAVSGPTNALVQYKLNSGNYTDITTIAFPSTAAGGASTGNTVSLSGITELQNLTSGALVTFRIVPYGSTSADSAWYIYDKDDNNEVDFGIEGIVTNIEKVYYSKPTGSLHLTTTWGTNTDGTGTAPAAFNADNTTYKIVNRDSATISANWSVTGVNSFVIVGDSVTTTEFYPSPATLFTLGPGASMIINPSSLISIPIGATVNFSGRPVTLKSTAAGTAQIGTVLGILNGSTNITVERFIPSNGRKSYTLVSSPVASPSIYNAWQESGADTTGYGTIITGSTAVGNGFDGVSASGLPSIFTYDDTMPSGSKWRGLNSTLLNNVGAGTGYLLYVRGNRTVTPASTGPLNGDAVLRATGNVIAGDTMLTTLTSGAGKFSLIANPYPSAINWVAKADGTTRDIVLNNLDDIFYVYDPSINAFASYNGATNTLSPSTSKQPFKYIQSGQAFFVLANGANPTITFKEKAKVTTISAASNTVFGSTETVKPQLNINVYKAEGNLFADGAVAVFDKNYKAGVAKEDAIKFSNFNENVSLVRDGKKLGIEGRPFTVNDTLFVSLANFAKAQYSLIIDAAQMNDVNAVLEDKYTNTKLSLNLNSSNTYTFTVNGDAASFASDRFIITYGNTAAIVALDNADDNNLYVKLSPNPVSNQLLVRFKTATVENTVINIVNSLGQLVKSVNAGKVNQGNISIATSGLSSGAYTVQLISGDKKITSQQVVKE